MISRTTERVWRIVAPFVCGAILLASQAAANAKTSAADKKFAMAAAAGGAAEVTLGQLAAKQAAAQVCKDFGTRMVADHSKANADLMAIAAKKKMMLSTKMPADAMALHMKLMRLHGAAFDSTYTAGMLKAHRMDAMAFANEAKTGTDPDIKAFAARTLPVVKAHLAMLESMRGKMGMHHNMKMNMHAKPAMK